MSYLLQSNICLQQIHHVATSTHQWMPLTTLPKFNMESQNDAFQKQGCHFQLFHVKFWEGIITNYNLPGVDEGQPLLRCSIQEKTTKKSDATHSMQRKNPPEQICMLLQPRSSQNFLHILKFGPAIDGSIQAFLPATNEIAKKSATPLRSNVYPFSHNHGSGNGVLQDDF